MGKGEAFPAECKRTTDLRTGVEVLQLTDHKAHTHHLYFTNPGWYDGGRKLLVGSDRGNAANLYGVDLQTGEIRQLTDTGESTVSGSAPFHSTSVNPTRDEAYFWLRDQLVSIDLQTLDERLLYEVPAGFQSRGQTNVTADGAYVCVNVNEDLTDRLTMDLGSGYVGFEEYWAARPVSRIVVVPTAGGAARTVHEEANWIGHVNTSPTQPQLMSFCHEGPWHRVQHRIWMLDLQTGQVWKIRPTTVPAERVGHEYWFGDGEHLGYHGSTADGDPFHGAIRFDNCEQVEHPIARNSMHFHSNTLDLIVGDGDRGRPELLLWRLTDSGFDGPRVVLRHRGSFHIQAVHVHPRFSPDGRKILYTTDARGYGNPHLVDVPDFDDLPPAEE